MMYWYVYWYVYVYWDVYWYVYWWFTCMRRSHRDGDMASAL